MIRDVELELFGAFPGHDLDDDAAEALIWQHWPEKERKKEPGLFRQKWWDYRTLSVAHATYLFNHILTVQVRHVIRSHINDAPAALAGNGTVLDWNPIKAGDVFTPPTQHSRVDYWKRKIGGLIRARQAADADGIPYPVFIKAALNHFYFGKGTYMMEPSYAGGKRKTIPEVNWFNGEDCLFAVRSAWLETVQMRVQAATHPRYLAVNDDGHPDHPDHRDWLRQQIATRAVKTHVVARLVKDGFLTDAQAKAIA